MPAHGQPTADAPLPDFAKGQGLLPAVAQDAATGEVLMVAYMNAESFAETVATGRAVYSAARRGGYGAKGKKVVMCSNWCKSSLIATPTRSC